MANTLVPDDIINDILTKKICFNTLTASEQSAIRNNRSKPDLEFQHNENGTWKKFNLKWYDDYPWLCGSKIHNKLFCIACTIYQGDPWWSSDGLDNIKKFTDKANKHEATRVHIRNMESYVSVGRTKSWRCSSDVSKKLEKIMLRREVLSKIIDAVITMNKCGKNLDLFDENTKQAPGEMMLENFLCDPSVYKLIYAEVKDVLISTIEAQLGKDIKKEMGRTGFCSILVNRIITKDNEYSVLVRYVHEGRVKERFVGFYKIVQLFDLAQIFNTVTGDVRKAVCHSYDGTYTLKPLRLGLKPIMPKLLLLPNHFQKISTTLLQNLESIEEVRTFIRTLTFINDFFKEPNRAHYITIYGLNFPVESDNLWKFHSKAIQSIISQQIRIIKIINSIIFDPYIIDLDTVNSALYIKKNLQCPLFLMFCNLFMKIFAHIDHLSNIVKKKLQQDVRSCLLEAEQTIKNIANMKASVCINNFSLEENKNKLKSDVLTSDKANTFKTAAAKVISTVSQHLLEIFGDLRFLKFAELLDHHKFSSYWNKFPKTTFSETMDFYQSIFNASRLETELMTIYSDPSKQMNSLQLFHFMYDNDLTSAYKETYRLLRLYHTYPLAPIDNGNCKWKKLKKFLNSPGNENRSALLFIESYDENTDEYVNFKNTVIRELESLKGE